MPANLPGVFWSPDDGVEANPDGARLYRVANGEDVAIEFEGGPPYEVRVLEPLFEGEEYALAFGSVCFGSGAADETASTYTFATTPAQAFPEQLGELLASPQEVGTIALATSSGSCTDSLEAAYVDLELDLDPGSEPWQEVLVFETLVDGVPWRPSAFLPLPPQPGESWRGRGADRVFTVCTDDTPDGFTESGLSPGVHTVSMRALLPGSEASISSASVSVVVSCEDGAEASTGTDTGSSDSGTDTEIGTDGDMMTDTSSSATTGGLGSEDGCACATGAGRPRRAVGLSAIALLALLSLRRRSARKEEQARRISTLRGV